METSERVALYVMVSLLACAAIGNIALHEGAQHPDPVESGWEVPLDLRGGTWIILEPAPAGPLPGSGGDPTVPPPIPVSDPWQYQI